MQVGHLRGVYSNKRNTLLKYCIASENLVYMLLRFSDLFVNGAKPIYLFHLPMMQVIRYVPASKYVLIMRMFDILVSGVTLLVRF